MTADIRTEYRIATDVGGTFTDLVLDDGRDIRAFKAATTPDDPTRGVLDAVTVAATALGTTRADLLSRCRVFVHGTTRALNAMLTGTTARTGLMVSSGHRDILLLREGGRHRPFDLSTEYPEPLVARALTVEVGGRLLSDGSELSPLDEESVRLAARRLREAGVEAVAVCLLWSVVDGRHELRVAEILAEELPGIPVTLSHRLNPVMREYRRASSTAIDASLKPLMTSYITVLEDRMREAGLSGEVLLVSSTGSSIRAQTAAEAPIHTLNSGPSMAPEAARQVVRMQQGDDAFDAIVFDSGGTTCDISLVRAGRVVSTRETWIGAIGAGHITGFSSVDVRSIAAGGGSIADVDRWGLLQVGPRSAGAVPGPACYGRGGTEATVTDASLVAGYLDPHTFLDGALPLDRAAAEAAVGRIAERLGVDLREAAESILSLATEQMVNAIELITLGQGVDPREAVLVGGGGAAGINIAEIARRLGVARAVVPAFGSVLAAAGGMLSPLADEASATAPTSSDRFDVAGVGRAIEALAAVAERFAATVGAAAADVRVEWSVEARYRRQVWDLVVPVPDVRLRTPEARTALDQAFHHAHAVAYGTSDPGGVIEYLTWRMRASAGEAGNRGFVGATAVPAGGRRLVSFGDAGVHETPVVAADELRGRSLAGPAIIEATATSIVLPPGARASATAEGHVVIVPRASQPAPIRGV